MLWNFNWIHHRDYSGSILGRFTTTLERLQMIHQIIKLDQFELCSLRDVIRDWLSQYKDDRPKATIQRVQQTLDTLENPSHQSIKEVYESVRVDYEKIGEVYEGDC